MDVNAAFQPIDVRGILNNNRLNTNGSNTNRQNFDSTEYYNSPEYKAKLAEHMACITKNTKANYSKEIEEAIKKQKEQEVEDRKIKKQVEIDNYVIENGEYWEYECAQCFVPIKKFTSVPCMDKCNTVTTMLYNGELNITKTEMYMDCPPYTVDEYHEKYCEYQNNKWIYVGRKN